MAKKKKVSARPKSAPRDGRGTGKRNPKCPRNKANLPRLGRNRKPRPKR